jgi:hypothetical protein
MKSLILVCGALVAAGSAQAQKPPVQVKVVVDDPEEGFFAEKPSGGGGASVAVPKTEGGANVNTNTQVVNVVVNGANATAKAEPPAPEPSPEEEELEEMLAEHRHHDHRREPAVETKVRREKKRSDDGRVGVHRGSVSVSQILGVNAMSGYIGLAGEVMLSNRFGLRLSGAFGSFGPEDGGDFDLESGEEGNHGRGDGDSDERRDWDANQRRQRARSGYWAHGGVDLGSIERGKTHIEELGLTFHLRPESRFDLFTQAGIAHYGFDLKAEDGERTRGGALYWHAAVGAGYFGKRFFANATLSWYPVELTHYAIGEEVDDRRDVTFAEREKPFDARRVFAGTQFGFRFN